MSITGGDPSTSSLDGAIINSASINVPSIWTRVFNSPVFPAAMSGLLTFIILVLIKPQFVQREHSSAIALPKLNYFLIFGLSFAVSVLVLAIPYFLKY